MTGRQLLVESQRRQALTPTESAREALADPGADARSLRYCAGTLRAEIWALKQTGRWTRAADTAAYLLCTALDTRAAGLESAIMVCPDCGRRAVAGSDCWDLGIRH